MFYNINKIVAGIGMVTLLALFAIQIPGANAHTRTDSRSEVQMSIPIPTADYLRDVVRPDNDGFGYKTPDNDQEVFEAGWPDKGNCQFQNDFLTHCDILWCVPAGGGDSLCVDTGSDVCYDDYGNSVPCN